MILPRQSTPVDRAEGCAAVSAQQISVVPAGAKTAGGDETTVTYKTKCPSGLLMFKPSTSNRAFHTTIKCEIPENEPNKWKPATDVSDKLKDPVQVGSDTPPWDFT